ncbi:stage II sporulation protein M [Halobellus inordinatus]|uniref:stage II sporulation protein M n=1 Tax=Halobellus inordinatus TaxID=1126236 RepID=UPI00210E712D
MNPSSALRTGGRMLWERSASVIPVYLLVSGLYGVARVPLLLAALLALWLAASSGRLQPFVDALRDAASDSAPPASGDGSGSVDLGAVDPDQLGPGLDDAVANLLTPDIVGLVLLGVFLSVLLSVVVSAVGGAAAISTVFGLLKDEDGVLAAVEGAGTYWRSFLGVRVLFLAALAIVLVPIGAAIVWAVGSVVGASTGGVAASPSASAAAGPSSEASVLALAVVGIGSIVAFVAVLVVFLLFAFAEQAVVVDDVGAVAAVRRSVRFPFRRPAAFLGYVVVAFGALVVTGSVAGVASVAGATRVTGLVSAIVVPPVLDGFKTSLYAERPLPPTLEVAPPGDRLRSAFGGGLRAVGGFVADRPLANVASLAIVLAGGAIGWRATASLGVSLPVGSDVGNVFGAFPGGTFVNLAVNNWLVASDVAFSGLAAGIPAVVTLGFNGLIVGAVGGVFDPIAFLALVAPHGVVEIPALVVGGGLGLWLGGVGLGAARGRLVADEVASAIRRTYRVLLGLVPLFVLAAFIEAFLTPAIASLVLTG